MKDETSQGHLNRRAFLAAVPALACAPAIAADAEGELAVAGGSPGCEPPDDRVSRAKFYDQQERTELTQAFDSHSLFRFYGPETPQR